MKVKKEVLLTGKDKHNQSHYRPPVFDLTGVKCIRHSMPTESDVVVVRTRLSPHRHNLAAQADSYRVCWMLF